MKRFFAAAIVLSSIFTNTPAMANDYGATSLGTGEQLTWRFIDSGSNHSRISRGSRLSGYACRVLINDETTTIDHYQIMTEAGSDYQFLQPINGATIRRSGSSVKAEESTPEDEQTILTRATLAPGNFWYENNVEPTEIGLVCVDQGITGVIQYLHQGICRNMASCN